jgi:hypothetical protein
MKIEVKRLELIKIVRKNRENHRKIFESALEGYRKAAIKKFEAQLELVKANKPFESYFNLAQPVDQTKDYDRVIGMLELAEDRVISLSEDDYSRYVLDKWDWTQHFSTSNSAYTNLVSAEE